MRRQADDRTTRRLSMGWRGGARRLALMVLIGASADAGEFPVTNAAEIKAAVKKAGPGDVLVMRDGAWTDQDIVFQGEGTRERPITLRAATPGAVILDGSSRLRIGGRHLVVEGLWFRGGRTTADVVEFRASSKVAAEDCVLRSCGITDVRPADDTSENRWVSLYGAGNGVDACYFAGKRNAGTTLVVWVDPERPNQHVIRRNHFGPRPPLGANGGETIRVGDSRTSPFVSRTLVEGNLFERCNGEVEIVSNKSCENVYRGNTFVACEGALTFRHGKRCTAEGNFFLGLGRPKTGGIRIIDEGHTVMNNYFADLRGEGTRSALTLMNGRENSALNGYFQVRSARVVFNTFVHCRHNFLIGYADGGETLAPADCVVANNVVLGTEAPLVTFATKPENFAWRGNVFFGASIGSDVPDAMRSDPLLVKDSEGLWRPSTTSPLLHAAADAGILVERDMDGQARPVNGSDIGADQASAEPAIRRPLQAKDVGPQWLSPAARNSER